MANVKCSCGCEVFFQAQTVQVDEGDLRIWKAHLPLRATVTTTPILMCIQCNKALTPQVSFPGRNNLDPEVIAYAEVLEAVKKRNERLDNVQTGGFNRDTFNIPIG